MGGSSSPQTFATLCFANEPKDDTQVVVRKRTGRTGSPRGDGVPVTAVSPTPRHALLALARLWARYPLPCAGSRPSRAADVCAQARKLVVAALPWRAAEDEPLLSRYDLLDIRHRNNKRAVAEDAAPDEERIRPIEPRAEPNRLDRAKTRRVRKLRRPRIRG